MNARVGPADFYADGEWNLVCSMCGRKMKSGDAVKNWQGMWRHRRCNDVRQPQDFVRVLKDDQTVPFSQPPSDVYVQININIPIQVSPNAIDGVAGVLLNENGTAILNEDGMALMTESFYANVLIPEYTEVQSINWTWQSGGNQILIRTPANPLTQLVLDGNIVGGQKYTGVLLCTVTSVQGGVGTGTCNVSITA